MFVSEAAPACPGTNLQGHIKQLSAQGFSSVQIAARLGCSRTYAWMYAGGFTEDRRKQANKSSRDWRRRQRVAPLDRAMLHHVRICCDNAVRVDKKRGRPHSNRDDLVNSLRPFPLVCPKTNVVLDYRASQKVKGGADNAASIDAIIPELGHVVGNVRIVARRFNTVRGDSTAEELRIAYEDQLAIEQAIHQLANDLGPDTGEELKEAA